MYRGKIASRKRYRGECSRIHYRSAAGTVLVMAADELHAGGLSASEAVVLSFPLYLKHSDKISMFCGEVFDDAEAFF